MIEAGTPAPDFSLPDQSGNEVSLESLKGKRVVLVFYPSDFSPVCTDQLNVYQEVLGELRDRGVELYGVSVDSSWSYRSPSPLEIPGANLIFDALEDHAAV
jgi:peroxiredoxin